MTGRRELINGRTERCVSGPMEGWKIEDKLILGVLAGSRAPF